MNEVVHCAYTLQYVHATVSIESPNNTILKRMISISVAFHLFIQPDPFRIWIGILYSVYEGYFQVKMLPVYRTSVIAKMIMKQYLNNPTVIN